MDEMGRGGGGRGDGTALPRRVLVADDRARSRSGLRAVLDLWPEIVVVGEAADGREALRQVEALRPDVVLMDARMPLLGGVAAARLVKAQWPEVRVVVLTMHAGCRAEALAAGADAFLIKGCPREDLLRAIMGQ